MPTTAQRTFSEFGQSLWYDNVQRGSLRNGEFARLVARGVRGCTSNPTIFDKAIGGSPDYDAALRALVSAGASVDDIYHDLVIEDVQAAADILRPLYDSSSAVDGYISLEVQPKHALDAAGTVAEALALAKRVGRPNLMVKVPATVPGLEAITELTAAGISVNVTLIFSRQRYVEVAEAFIHGLELALERGHDVSRIASVASFFVSRIDAKVDAWLTNRPELSALRGKVAIANAKLAYVEYERLFASERFASLKAAGAQVQRLLWASTGTKDPSYADTLYVDELIGQDTVNTVPPATLDAFLDHGTPQASLTRDVARARGVLDQLEHAGFDLEALCATLLSDGLQAFTASMDHLYEVIAERSARLASGPGVAVGSNA